MLAQQLYLACTITVAPLVGGAAGAQQTQDSVRVNINPTLAAQAKISRDSAQHLALTKIPGATVRSVELEREHGKLIYSFDLRAPGQPGVEEVNVDARTGAIVSTVHESAQAERREAAHERHGRKHKRHRHRKPRSPRDSTAGSVR